MRDHGMRRPLLAAVVMGLAACGPAAAEPVRYEMDPEHTYPSFEGDHLGGLSVWRGKFNHSRGHVILDREAETGTVHVTVDLTSVDFGHEEMNAHATGPEFFDVARYPEAVYQGTLTDFENGAPTRIEGELNLHGVTRPLDLEINSFKCMPHPMLGRELCGADAEGSFDRSEFGLDVGKDFGFDMNVKLRVQVEALKAAD
ncbi:MAG TPA: YceI family protein [Pseudomonadales bacterium]